MTKEQFHVQITSEQRKIYNQIACDLETGNHLIRPRSKEYWIEFERVSNIYKSSERTELEDAILQFIRECSDYDYFHSLPEDQRLTGSFKVN